MLWMELFGLFGGHCLSAVLSSIVEDLASRSWLSAVPDFIEALILALRGRLCRRWRFQLGLGMAAIVESELDLHVLVVGLFMYEFGLQEHAP